MDTLKFRIKRGWFGRTKVIVQVPDWDWCPASGQRYIFWRDATESDMKLNFHQELQGMR